MKLLVFSDSHGITKYMKEAIETEKPDYVIHLGDHTRDADAIRLQYPELPLVSVRGNCDFDASVPDQLLLEWDGVRVLMAHGHRYSVKSGLLRLALGAREAQADMALFGHTHLAYCAQEGGCWLFNPGTCGLVGRGPTYGVIEIRKGVPTCSIHDFD